MRATHLVSLIFVALSTTACTSSDSSPDRTQDYDAGVDTNAVGCAAPDLGDPGNVTGRASKFTEDVSIALVVDMGSGETGNLYFFVKHNEQLQAAPGTYEVDGRPGDECARDAACEVSAMLGDPQHDMGLSATTGTLVIDSIDVESLGRVSGSFSNLTFRQVDDNAQNFIDGGCEVRIGAGTFDVDLGLPENGGPM